MKIKTKKGHITFLASRDNVVNSELILPKIEKLLKKKRGIFYYSLNTEEESFVRKMYYLVKKPVPTNVKDMWESMRDSGLHISTNPIFKHMQERIEKTIEEKIHKIDTIIIDGYQKLTKNEKYTHKRKFAILKRLAIKYNIKVIVMMDLFKARNLKDAEKGYIDNNDIYDYNEFKSFVDFGYRVTPQNISLLPKELKEGRKSNQEDTILQLKENDIFKIMAGSYEDKLELFSSEKVMKSIDLQTIKNIYQEKYKQLNKTCATDRDNMYEKLIKFLQYLAYNKDYSQHSQEIATFVFDRLFELMSENFI